MKKLIFVMAAAILGLSQSAKAQTNLQTFYDFGREHVTTTLEMFKGDNWGNTFFFVDYDYATKNTPSGTYMEIARCINLWQDSKLGALSLQVEYNGGLGIFELPASYGGFGVNSAFLGGLDYFLHSSDFSNTLNLKVLYKNIRNTAQQVPLQLTAVWGCQNILGLKGLNFSGFADVWWESKCVFISEPQLWYNIGQLFGVDNLNIGGEVEFSYNFAGVDGFKCRPCLGTKWVF
ncbi:MAG: DUF5020 family protein [Bacteroidales bacterium]|nr:DUF5020 family protein [Bacteroidales bacterium]